MISVELVAANEFDFFASKKRTGWKPRQRETVTGGLGAGLFRAGAGITGLGSYPEALASSQPMLTGGVVELVALLNMRNKEGP